jgi:1-acyl-sn-glycerol-3-phosphate acyltransferase
VSCNSFNIWLTNKLTLDVSGTDSLNKKGWYLVISNHQSWLDILVLQKTFHGKIPFLKFFIKKELFWVPVLGLAWWALDMPFMKRYSRRFLEKNPHLRGKDLETTKKACRKFKNIPVSIINFVEGTRFAVEKHKKQQSPYKNLLKPKAGGIAFTLAAMGEQLNHILNVTIAYPKGARGFWAFLCGKSCEVKVTVETLPIHKSLLGDYFASNAYRDQFQEWLNSLWAEKDRDLTRLLSGSRLSA